jgi:hypothetical protein
MPERFATERAMETYRDVVEGLRDRKLTTPSTVARRFGMLSFYVASIVQPMRYRGAAKAVQGEIGIPEAFLSRTEHQMPTDLRADLVKLGMWTEELNHQQRDLLDPFLYAVAVSETARIWAAAWQEAGNSATFDIEPGQLVDRKPRVELRGRSLVENCEDMLNQAWGYYWYLRRAYATSIYITMMDIDDAKDNVEMHSALLTWAKRMEAAGVVPSAVDIEIQAKENRKNAEHGLRVLDQSVLIKDNRIFVNGRVVSSSDKPTKRAILEVLFLNNKNEVVYQVASERGALVAPDPEGFLPRHIYQFRFSMPAEKVPSFAKSFVVVLSRS